MPWVPPRSRQALLVRPVGLSVVAVQAVVEAAPVAALEAAPVVVPRPIVSL